MKKQYIQPSIKNHKLFFESALAAASPRLDVDNFDDPNDETTKPEDEGLDPIVKPGDGSDF